jgi:hypothetical protein
VEQLLHLHGFHGTLYGGESVFVNIAEENSVLKWMDGTLLENLNIFVVMQNSS